jgi:PLP dependent protein
MLRIIYQKISSSIPQDSDVSLICVSKKQPIESIKQIIQCDQKDFGENILQETLQKWPTLKRDNPQIKLHYLGKIQSNKLKQILELFDVIHSVDRLKIADKISQIAPQKPVFIQVNIGSEPQKNGVDINELDGFIQTCRDHLKLNIQGLMCVPPQDKPPESYFAHMQELTKKYRFKYLSMGMSGDYEIAIKYGATHLRIGAKIFGKRS